MNESKYSSKRTISRREFAVKGIIAVTALGLAGTGGYFILGDEQTKMYLNYHRMGHCAPSVMKTLLQINHIKNPGLLKTAGAMAGGIAGPRMECGAITVPVMFLGYQNGVPENNDDKLFIIRQVQAFYNAFLHDNGTTICTNIRDRKESGCWKAISGFYREFQDSQEKPVALSPEAEESYKSLINEFNDKRFHCSHSVLNALKDHIGQDDDLYKVTWPFLGGIAMLNRTCGALAGGVMALSSSLAMIESSYVRVARMNKLLKMNDKKAMNNDINKFNTAINKGRELGTWFQREFGSTTCLDICGYNFSRGKDVSDYISGKCIGKCSLIAEQVGKKVNSIISD
ncbi:MAG TPA: C-GCAxxG-C-C family protein [Bacteroidales bacterium]|nr:C-GCAxxG-C-C family protein [Bacteroidales bacterium]